MYSQYVLRMFFFESMGDLALEDFMLRCRGYALGGAPGLRLCCYHWPFYVAWFYPFAVALLHCILVPGGGMVAWAGGMGWWLPAEIESMDGWTNNERRFFHQPPRWIKTFFLMWTPKRHRLGSVCLAILTSTKFS